MVVVDGAANVDDVMETAVRGRHGAGDGGGSRTRRSWQCAWQCGRAEAVASSGSSSRHRAAWVDDLCRSLGVVSTIMGPTRSCGHDGRHGSVGGALAGDEKMMTDGFGKIDGEMGL
ncbi:hypothetical protein ACLOJK_027015 [Asimina triloba]